MPPATCNNIITHNDSLVLGWHAGFLCYSQRLIIRNWTAIGGLAKVDVSFSTQASAWWNKFRFRFGKPTIYLWNKWMNKQRRMAQRIKKRYISHDEKKREKKKTLKECCKLNASTENVFFCWIFKSISRTKQHQQQKKNNKKCGKRNAEMSWNMQAQCTSSISVERSENSVVDPHFPPPPHILASRPALHTIALSSCWCEWQQQAQDAQTCLHI